MLTNLAITPHEPTRSLASQGSDVERLLKASKLTASLGTPIERLAAASFKEEAVLNPLVTDELWEIVEPLLPNTNPAPKEAGRGYRTGCASLHPVRAQEGHPLGRLPLCDGLLRG